MRPPLNGLILIKTEYLSLYILLILKHVLFRLCKKPHPSNQMCFMLHELAFFGCHSQFVLYPYTFTSYSHSCKILQPYVAATVRMHSEQYFPLLIKKSMFVNFMRGMRTTFKIQRNNSQSVQWGACFASKTLLVPLIASTHAQRITE